MKGSHTFEEQKVAPVKVMSLLCVHASNSFSNPPCRYLYFARSFHQLSVDLWPLLPTSSLSQDKFDFRFPGCGDAQHNHSPTVHFAALHVHLLQDVVT